MNVPIFESTIEIDASLIAESPAVVREQIREYERADRKTFDLTIDVPESVTGSVMAALTEIPYGETRTYGSLAAALDTTPIVVGQACARNPVPVVVPCHRVVGSDGELKGYSAANGIATKRQLLCLERTQGATTQARLPMREANRTG